MKVNIFLVVISVLLAAILGYLAFDIARADEYDTLCGIGSGICFAATLIPILGLRYGSERIGVNIRTLSSLFFIIFAISQFCFAGFGVKMPYYVIINGLILMIFLASVYRLQQIDV